MSTTSNATDSERCYEDLRREVIDGDAGFAYGLAILLRRGMVSWLDTLATCTEPRSPRTSTQSRARLPPDARGQVVHVLAGMVLDLCALEGA